MPHSTDHSSKSRLVAWCSNRALDRSSEVDIKFDHIVRLLLLPLCLKQASQCELDPDLDLDFSADKSWLHYAGWRLVMFERIEISHKLGDWHPSEGEWTLPVRKCTWKKKIKSVWSRNLQICMTGMLLQLLCEVLNWPWGKGIPFYQLGEWLIRREELSCSVETKTLRDRSNTTSKNQGRGVRKSKMEPGTAKNSSVRVYSAETSFTQFAWNGRVSDWCEKRTCTSTNKIKIWDIEWINILHWAKLAPMVAGECLHAVKRRTHFGHRRWKEKFHHVPHVWQKW